MLVVRRRCLEGWGAAQILLLGSTQNGVGSSTAGSGDQVREGVLTVTGVGVERHGEILARRAGDGES